MVHSSFYFFNLILASLYVYMFSASLCVSGWWSDMRNIMMMIVFNIMVDLASIVVMQSIKNVSFPFMLAQVFDKF